MRCKQGGSKIKTGSFLVVLFCALSLVFTATPAQAFTACDADIDQNTFVDLADYSIFIAHFFTANPAVPRADIDGNGFVDLRDYSIFISFFFQACTPPTNTPPISEISPTITPLVSESLLSPTIEVTATQIPTQTPTKSPVPTATPSFTPTFTPTRTPTRTPTAIPTNTKTPTPLPTTTITVTDMKLINSDTEAVVRTMPTTDSIDLSTLPRFTMQFATSPAAVGSIRVQVSGPVNYSYYAARPPGNVGPYLVDPDTLDEMEVYNYHPLNWGVGTYTIRLTPYTQPSGGGQAGAIKTYTVNITKSGTIAPSPTPLSAGQVSSFSLINTNNGAVIRTLTNLESFSRTTNQGNFTVRVNTSPQTVGYVKLEVSGAQNFTSYENLFPYAIAPQTVNPIVYENWSPAVGTYTIKATPYGPTSLGTVGVSKTITFTITN